MWQRGIIVLIFLSAVAFLLILSAKSKVDRTSGTGVDFSPVAVDAVPREAEDARMLQLRREARSAMQALATEHLATEHLATEHLQSGRRPDGKPRTLKPAKRSLPQGQRLGKAAE